MSDLEVRLGRMSPRRSRIRALSRIGYDDKIARLTGNVLSRFLNPTPSDG